MSSKETWEELFCLPATLSWVMYQNIRVRTYL